jgi:predicted nucleotidyltransferase
MKPLYDALREIVESFDRLKLDYAIMGGIAVRVHGIARPTQDLDLMVALSPDHVATLFDVIEELGYTVPEHYRSGSVDRVAGMPIVKMRRCLVEHGLDVDVFLVDSAFQEEVLRRARFVQLDGFNARVISPEDLILLKLIAGRHRDLGDVLDVLFMQGLLDEEYMRGWAKELGVVDKLEQVLKESREM